MRQQYAAVQYLLTATVLGTLHPLFTGLAHASISHAADILHEPESSLIGRPIISDGAGLPVSLDSFNGLELRDNVGEDGEMVELDLVRRGYPSDAKSLGNNQFQDSTLEVGGIQWFFVTKEVVNGEKATTISTLPASLSSRGVEENDDVKLELRKRQQAEPLAKRDQTTVYLSLTTCRTPTSNSSGTVPGSFPQLEIYYSTDESLEKPGPGKDDSLQTMITAEGGFANANITTDGDIFIGVVARNSTTFSGNYEYQIAASIDAPFHSVHDDDSFLYFIDADVSAALLVTNNLTQSEPNSTNYQEWMKLSPPYTMFAHNINNSALAGLERSFCALDRLSTLGRISNSTEMGMTSRGLGNKPKEQFYITGLNRSSTYNGILAMIGNSTQSGNGIIGGGGSVWKAMNFSTKAGTHTKQTHVYSGLSTNKIIRRQLRRTLQPYLLLRSSLRSPRKPQTQKRQRTPHNLRHLRLRLLQKLQLQPPANSMLCRARITVLPRRRLRRLRNRLQTMALQRLHPSLRRFHQIRLLPSSPQRRSEFYKWLLFTR
jgi:calcium channel MID1